MNHIFVEQVLLIASIAGKEGNPKMSPYLPQSIAIAFLTLCVCVCVCLCVSLCARLCVSLCVSLCVDVFHNCLLAEAGIPSPRPASSASPSREHCKVLCCLSMSETCMMPSVAEVTSADLAVRLCCLCCCRVGKEYAETGITVNALAPAAIYTSMLENASEEAVAFMQSKIPMKRFGKTEELAATVAWVVSPEASFNTGFAFDFSGGRAVY